MFINILIRKFARESRLNRRNFFGDSVRPGRGTGNFEGMQMERLLFYPRTEIFSGKQDFLKGLDQNTQMDFTEWKMCVPFATFY